MHRHEGRCSLLRAMLHLSNATAKRTDNVAHRASLSPTALSSRPQIDRSMLYHIGRLLREATELKIANTCAVVAGITPAVAIAALLVVETK
jgi:hypothetical protein